MSKPKHTPGPWKLDEDQRVVIAFDGNEMIDVADINDVPNVYQSRQANARLIAMAPTMLKGLKLAVMEFERIAYQKKCDPGILESLKAAIAKAEGRLAEEVSS